MDTATVTDYRELTDSERAEFSELEETILAGLQVYYKVGAALLRIREARLYRADYGSFEAYCIDRWSMGRSYANKLIAASEVIVYLGTSVPIPANEAQARPLTTIEPEHVAEVWQVVKDTAPDGIVTSGHIKSVVTVCKEVLVTGAIDNGDGESVNVHDLFKLAVAEETKERIQRYNEHIASASVNALRKPYKGLGAILAIDDGSLHVRLDKEGLEGLIDLKELVGKRVLIVIREAKP